MSDLDTLVMETVAGGVVLALKVVPGASRSKVAGVLGEALKVAVAAPPEGGKANREVIAVLAAVLRVKPAAVSIESGETQPRKRVLIRGISAADVRALLTTAL